MLIIQLRGTHGAGKTTAVREYIEKGNFIARDQRIRGAHIIYQFDGKIAIIGKYCAAASGGIDGYITNKDVLKNTIAIAAKEIQPEVLVFEGVMYGQTFQFSYDIARWAKAKGYEYCALCLHAAIDEQILRVYQRNDGKEFDVAKMLDKYKRGEQANVKLAAKGVWIEQVDTSKIEYGSMYKPLEEVIEKYRSTIA